VNVNTGFEKMEKDIDDLKRNNVGRIIVPIDESAEMDKVIEKALVLAKEIQRNVVALYVVDTPRLTEVIPPNETATAWETILSAEGHKILDEIEKKGKKMGVQVVKKIVEGIPDNEITKAAKKNDLIVMGCKSRSIFDKLLTSSVCEKVIDRSSSSIMTYRIK
jgi:nucleotide-binding universal stress UspA family protein